MENQTNQINQNKQSPETRKNQLINCAIEGTVIKEPTEEIITNKETNEKVSLYATHVLINGVYDPFTYKVYSKEKPSTTVGDIIKLQVNTTAYKIKMAK